MLGNASPPSHGASAAVIDIIGHIMIVLVVIGSATYLAAIGEIKSDTIATVYGAALGFTTAGVISRRPVSIRGTDVPPGTNTEVQ